MGRTTNDRIHGEDMLQDSRKTIFLADRSEAFLMYLRILLERMGFRVVPLKKGSLVRNLVQVRRPDVMLLGGVLGDMGASSLLDDLEADGRGDIPVVLICNEDDDACRRRSDDSQNVRYLGRPVNIFRLYRMIYDIIRFSKGEKRTNLRASFRERVTVIHGGDSADYWATTISEGGVYLRTRNPFPGGEEILVDIPLGFEATTRFPGRVLYAKTTVADEDSEPGVAIRFDPLSAEQEAQLRVCILGLLVGDLLEEQEEPVFSLVSRTNDLYEDIVLEHIRIGQELKKSQGLLRNLVEHLPLGAVTFTLGTDGDLTVCSQNPTAGKLLEDRLGVGAASEAIPLDWNGSGGWETVRRVAREGGAVNMGDVRYRQKPKDRILNVLAFQPTPGNVTLLLDDISVRRRQEEESLRLQKLESLGLLAGGIAHDFNNILQHILGNVALGRVALDGLPGVEKAVSLLDQAERGIDAAGNLTRQMLTFARGGIPIMEPLSPGPVVEEVARFCLMGSSVTVHFDLDAELCDVEGDAGQLHQVFSNLLINAKQAMPRGGAVTVNGRNVVIDEGHPMLQPGRYVVIRIEDTGIGIPDKILPNIFDPYFSTKQEGSGLGLSIAYSIVKRHGGWIDVSSVAAEGSCFGVYLPALSVRAAEDGETCRKPLSAGNGRLLVMDDEEHVRRIFREMLETLGFEVVCVRDGEEALRTFETSLTARQAFDAVILDLTVRGGMGGEAALKRLREIDPDVKALATSGYSDSAVLANPAEHGFKGILPKPVKIETLANTLRETIQQ